MRVSITTIATGAVISSAFALFQNTLAARPPSALTRDDPPQPCETDKLVAADAGYYSFFGAALDLQRDLLAIGSHSNQAYLYRFDSEIAQWIEEINIEKPDSMDFGYSVELEGNWLIVGAPGDEEQGWQAGCAYVFRYDGSTWVQQQKLLASDGGELDYFGCSVAIDGDFLVIGADEHFFTHEGTGWAKVFHFDGSSWIEQQTLAAHDGEEEDRFGGSVAIQDDIILVGAIGDDNFRGSAYCFVYDPDLNMWVENQKLQASGGGGWDLFGRCVSISGDKAIIGEDFSDDDAYEAGTAHIYRLDSEGLWVEEQELHASNAGAEHHFGYSASIDGDVAIVGATWAGAYEFFAWAYVFRFDGQTWNEVSVLQSNQPPENHFGECVALDGDRAIVGAPYEYGQSADEGAVYIYDGLLGLDCNDNLVSDYCDIFFGTSQDLNDNGIPDECEECPEDLNGDGVVNIDDLFQVLAAWGTCDDCPEDLDDSGIVDIDDIFAVLAAWGPC
ncbi:MAG: hypothetical protein JSV91_14625 [Phycisphaerales bacterium]|nr:MAG: hypothetical protein JSV91_14625 [Phycisphaerales bacterium]